MSNHNQNLSLKTLNLQIEDNQLSTRRKLVESDKKPSNETIMIKKQGKKQSVLVDLAKTTANIQHVSSMRPFSQGLSNSSKFLKKKVAVEQDVMFSSNLSNVDKLMRMIVAFSNRMTKRVEGVGIESQGTRST